MRIDRAYIDGFRNLSEFEINFDERRLTTVIIGENGAGKSNFIEALVEVFRSIDLNRGAPHFRYEVDYRLDGKNIRLSNLTGRSTISVDGDAWPRKRFDDEKDAVFPDMVFGYYSGGSRRLERLFDAHQRRYYDAIKRNDDPAACRTALDARRLFYCRPIHGVFALLSFLAFPQEDVLALLRDRLGIIAFHSALAHFREPWFAKTRPQSERDPFDLWGAEGPAGACARRFLEIAFRPISLVDRPIDDYRDKGESEPQLGAFMRNRASLARFAEAYDTDRDMFAALEAADISDLFRELYVWVTRADDESGDLGFADFSDGERQLLMVLGLMRISRGRRVLFLLDEPDTHLNPAWQQSYLELIRHWTGEGEDADKCQFIMTTHNPLTISALRKEEVRVLSKADDGAISASTPYADPRGLGFTATLTEIFGLPSSLDPETQRDVDTRNVLAAIHQRSDEQERQLIAISDKLNRLGFLFEDREPLYQDFLRAWHDLKYADRPVLTPEQIEARRSAMKRLIGELSDRERAN